MRVFRNDVRCESDVGRTFDREGLKATAGEFKTAFAEGVETGVGVVLASGRGQGKKEG